MDIEMLREYCLSKPATEESTAFEFDTLVFKVAGKIFLIVGLYNVPIRFNVKTDPEEAEELRERYACVHPGYHMNKKHWNTVIIDGSVSTKLLKEWIDKSYELVVNNLPVKTREELKKKK